MELRPGRLLPAAALPLVAYLVVVLVAPAAVLVLYSFYTADFFAVEQTLTLASWRELLDSSLYQQLLLKSLGIGLLVALLTVVLGFTMAYAFTFRLGRWGPRLLVVLMATLLASYIVRIYAWKTILGTEGLLNDALLRLGIIDQPLSFLLYGYFAIVLTLIYVYLPIAVLPIYAGLQDVDPRVLEASRDLGASGARTFWTVTVPLALPAIRIAFAFTFVLAAADYVTPSLVGGLRGQMIGSTIANQFGGSSDYPLGSALSLALIAGFAVVLLSLWLLGRGAAAAGHAVLHRPSRHGARPPGALVRAARRVPWSSLATVLLLVFLLAPLAVVIVFSFTESRIPVLPYDGFTMHWYGDVLGDEAFHRVVRTSATVALIGVAGALLIGVPAAYALARRRFRLERVVALLAYTPLVVPGVVIGVAILTAAVDAGITLSYRTAAAAHVMLLLPYVVLVLRARFATMNPQLEEAARDLGARRSTAFRTVTLPQVSTALLAAAILALAVSLDELIVTNFIVGTDATIPTWLLGQLRVGLTPAINAVAVLLLAAPLLLVGLAALVFRARGPARLGRTLGGG